MWQRLKKVKEMKLLAFKPVFFGAHDVVKRTKIQLHIFKLTSAKSKRLNFDMWCEYYRSLLPRTLFGTTCGGILPNQMFSESLGNKLFKQFGELLFNKVDYSFMEFSNVMTIVLI